MHRVHLRSAVQALAFHPAELLHRKYVEIDLRFALICPVASAASPPLMGAGFGCCILYLFVLYFCLFFVCLGFSSCCYCFFLGSCPSSCPSTYLCLCLFLCLFPFCNLPLALLMLLLPLDLVLFDANLDLRLSLLVLCEDFLAFEG